MNDYVWVRLNDRGRDIHRQNFLALFGNLASGTSFEYEAPQAINGWSKFQLWVLMHEFGKHVYNGCIIPFEDTTISLTDPTKENK